MTETMVGNTLTESFVIEGGQALHGTVRAAGNKNGVLPILAACVLTSEPVELHNVPRIRDVDTMLELLADIGVEVDWIGPNDVRVHAAEIRKTELDHELCSRMRASFLLAGPLLVRAGSAVVAPPGGDVIGRRRLDPHIHGFTELGVDVEAGDTYDMRTDGIRGANVFLDEASVMATENIVMAASLGAGRDDRRQRGMRAARPGSLPLPRLARREDRGDRVERPADQRGRESARRLVDDRPGSRRGRRASSGSPR